MSGSNHVRAVGIGVLLIAMAAGRGAWGQASPDFDTAPFMPLDCGQAGDPVGDETPGSIDFVGDATYPATFVARDATYLYFRYRMNESPAGPKGFDQYVWTALMQVPSGSPYQYQYQISLDGKSADDDFGNSGTSSGDTVELWANTMAEDIDFSPLFNDPSEVRIYAQRHDFSSGATVNTSPLARSLPTGDGSSFGGDPDYFVDFAVPIAVLIAEGVVTSAADLDDTLFLLATSTNPNNYNRGALPCAFVPETALTIQKAVSPPSAPANTDTLVLYTIDVQNVGAVRARGVVIEDAALASYMSNVQVAVSSADPTVSWTVVSTSPLEVRVPRLPAGSSVRVQLSATAHPQCHDGDFTNNASAFATNARPVSGSAPFQILFSGLGSEICDGIDNNCNGQVDEGGDALCDDADPCTGVETCGGASGCQPGTPTDCSDGDPCTADTCDALGTCAHAPILGCVPCTMASECDDADACTTDACPAGACTHSPLPGCGSCASAAECDDANACTTDTCPSGTCAHAPIPGCVGSGEICGNCLDDDGDGLIDAEDPDCCAAPDEMAMKRLFLKPPAGHRKSKLLLKGLFAHTTPPGFDPTAQDTEVQVSDDAGEVFCATIPAARWQHRAPTVFRFRDQTGLLANGIKRGRFKIRHDGGVMFRSRGRKLALRSVQGTSLRVTVGVGNRCTRATMSVEKRRSGAVVLPH